MIALSLAACSSPRTVSSPAPFPGSKPDWFSVTSYLDSAVAVGAAPGAVLAISYQGERFVHPTGQLGADEAEPAQASTIYDLGFTLQGDRSDDRIDVRG